MNKTEISKELKNMYVMVRVNSKGMETVDYSSMAWYRKDCVKKFMKGVEKFSWKDLTKKHGWSCKKVNVTFETTK